MCRSIWKPVLKNLHFLTGFFLKTCSVLVNEWTPDQLVPAEGRPPALFWGWISQTVWSGHTLRWAGFSSHSWKVWIRGIWACVTAQLFLCTPGTPKAPETPKSFKAVVVVSLAGAELPNSWSLGAPSVSDFTPLLLCSATCYVDSVVVRFVGVLHTRSSGINGCGLALYK